jgi:hypothetical protein
LSATVDQLLEQATAALASAVKAEKEHGGGMRSTLGGIHVSAQHGARAMSVGQNVDSLLAQARRQILELANTIRIIAATMPPGDANAAPVAAIIDQLNNGG